MEAEDILVKEDFYQRQYGILFEAMVELYQEGKPVDLITLQDKLKEKDVPEALVQSGLFPGTGGHRSHLHQCPAICADRP